jgi:hypothetical protein
MGKHGPLPDFCYQPDGTIVLPKWWLDALTECSDALKTAESLDDTEKALDRLGNLGMDTPEDVRAEKMKRTLDKHLPRLKP